MPELELLSPCFWFLSQESKHSHFLLSRISHMLMAWWFSRKVGSDSCDPMDCSPPGSSVHGDYLGKNTGLGCHFLLQGIFLTKESNPGLLHCRQILYWLNYEGSPFYHWVVFYYIYVPHLLYPLICRWIFRLFPCLAFCKWCCYAHWGERIFWIKSFLQIYAQERDCRIIW